MDELLPIRRKTLSNQSNNQLSCIKGKKYFTIQVAKFITYYLLINMIMFSNRLVHCCAGHEHPGTDCTCSGASDDNFENVCHEGE